MLLSTNYICFQIFKGNSSITNRLLRKRSTPISEIKFAKIETECESEAITPLSPDPFVVSEIETKRVQIISNKPTTSEVFKSNFSTVSSYQSTGVSSEVH